MDSIEIWFKAIKEEYARAMRKFPDWHEDPVVAAAVVAEESGELIRAALQYRNEDGKITAMKKEAIQTAAMAIRFLMNDYLYDRREIEEGEDFDPENIPPLEEPDGSVSSDQLINDEPE
jgi:hypothetical protein